MSRVVERSRTSTRPLPDEAVLAEPAAGAGRTAAVLRTLGALAVLVVGAVHLEQYVAAHYDAVPTIGPLFVLNFAGATLLGLGLLVPLARLRALHALLALGAIGLAATSIVFLFISEHQKLFGFEESGYRAAIVISLVAEALTVLFLGAYLAVAKRR
jgi:hypothetical protein